MGAFKYQHILEAMAEEAKTNDKPWEIVQRIDEYGQWRDLSFGPCFKNNAEYRLKPKTIMIGDREVSEPVKLDYAKLDEWYFYPNIRGDLGISIVKFKINQSFFGSNADGFYFKLGLVRKTEEEARELGEALIEVLKKALGVQNDINRAV